MTTTSVATASKVTMDLTGKGFGVLQMKTGGKESAGSFHNLLQKSTQAEKPVAELKADDSKEVKDTKTKDAVAVNASAARKEPNKDKQVGSERAAASETSENAQVVSKETPEAKALKEFAKKVQETLGLSAEEMSTWLSSMGMAVTDLLDAGKLQSFFMQVKGIDVSGLLTEQETAGQLKMMLNEAAAVKEKFPEIEEALPEAKNFEAFVKEAVEQSAPVKAEQVTASVTGQSDQTEQNQGMLNQESGKEKPSEIKAEAADDNALAKNWVPEAFDREIRTEQTMITANGLERVTTTVTVKEIFNQIVTKFTAQTMGDTSKLTVQLNPEHLGKLAFQVVSKAGQMTGQFVAENEAVKSVIEAQVSQLKVHLAEQGIKVDDVKVVVGDTVNYFADDKPKEQENDKKKLKKAVVGAVENKAVTEEEKAEAVDSVSLSSGTVDFTA